METEDNNITNVDVQENLESSLVDVVGIEINDSPAEDAQEESITEQTPESLALPETSTEAVRGKEHVLSEKKKLIRLPLSRVKHIMKMDPDVTIVSSETVFLVTKATELFLQSLSRETARYTHLSKRKTVQRRDVDAAIDSVPHLCFLEGALE